MSETWKPVVGFGGLYEISDLGRVRSLDRVRVGCNAHGPFTFRRKGAVLKEREDADGYLRVVLQDYGRTGRFVHHLVLDAFVGLRPDAAQTRHLDGNRKNNVPDNLVWGDEFGQWRDRRQHGTDGGPAGEANGSAKLTMSDVLAIRVANGTQEQIAARFGICQANVSIIRSGKTWLHV